MRRLSGCILLLLVVHIGLCAQDFFPVASIADSLSSGSNAVIRYHNTTYTRTSSDSYSESVAYAVSILNARGKSAGKLHIHYDRNSEITELAGIVYGSHGLPEGKIKRKEFNDYASNASYTLFSDHRVKTFSPAISGYPYTVEYRYTVQHRGIVGYPTWIPRSRFDVAVEKAKLLIETPLELEFRYLSLNYDFAFSSDTIDGTGRYTWRAEGMKALESEPSLPHYLDYVPAVFLSPVDIDFENTSGSFADWDSYGDWVYGLIENRDLLPEETVEEIGALTAHISDPRQKTKAVYEYMQGKTRYVNVTLGIGGFQPLPAYEVDEKGYGDCKALSNYTRALLKCAGIQSYYAEIGNGSSREIKFPDFASINQTNHIILCVPFENDTVWLECTSQTKPFGYVGAGNSDRYALLITEDGGKLARTPVYRSHDNNRSTTSTFEFDEGGNAKVTVISDFTNAEYDDIDGLLHLSPGEQRKALLQYMPLEGFSLEQYSLEEQSDQVARVRVSLEGNAAKLAKKAGSRLVLGPSYIFSQTSFRPISDKREIDLYKAVGYHHKDHITILIPDGFSVGQLPAGTDLESVYGNYRIAYSSDEEGIHVTRDLEVLSGNYDQSQFEEINAFFKDITRADKKKVIIGK